MGDGFQTLADIDASADEAARLAGSVTRWLVGSGIVGPDPIDSARFAPGPNWVRTTHTVESDGVEPSGLSVVTERTVFHPGLNIGDDIACPHCLELVVLDEISETVGQWYDGGDGVRRCVGCGRENALNDWRWDPPWAFGWLGFVFLNWPPIRTEFVAELSVRLGHRVVLVDGCW